MPEPPHEPYSRRAEPESLQISWSVAKVTGRGPPAVRSGRLPAHTSGSVTGSGMGIRCLPDGRGPGLSRTNCLWPLAARPAGMVDDTTHGERPTGIRQVPR